MRIAYRYVEPTPTSELGPGTLFTVCFHSYKVLRVVKIIEKESRLMVARGWRQGRMENYSVGVDFQFYQMKRVLGIDGGDGSSSERSVLCRVSWYLVSRS